jgi:glycosyltransferase involved in cell wall biosynthesis
VTVSVIIATYQRPELLLERSIPSVLAQTHTDWELHVVGDGCTEETLGSMGDITRLDSRIRFTNRPRPEYPPNELDAWHVSGSHAWNYGLDTARGEYICLLADDDEYHPEFIEAMLSAIIENDAGLAWCASEIIKADGSSNGFLGVQEPLRFGGQSGGEFMWRRNDTRFDPECWMDGEPNDWNFFRRMLEAGVKPVHVRRALYRYYPTNHIPRGSPNLPW